MKLKILPGETSRTIRIFISDSSSTAGAGLTGLAYGTVNLDCYYIREGESEETEISLVTAVVGTWASGGFKEINATNMPGWYEFGIPDALLAVGAEDVAIHLKGATNMAPLPIEIQFDIQYLIIRGLLGANCVLDDFSYDGNKKATVGNVYAYDTAANAAAHVKGAGGGSGLLLKVVGAATIDGAGNTTMLKRTVA